MELSTSGLRVNFIIIPSAEIFRSILLQQKKRWVTVLTYVAMVLLDLMVFSHTGILDSFTRFREFMAMVLFPAITGNILYHYLSAKYGAVPNSIYRLVIALYPYLLSQAPGTPSSMLAFGRLVAPLLIYLFISYLYEKRKYAVSRRKSIANTVGGCLLLVAMALVIMLISYQFRFGLLVVGSESMTGAIDKGDAIIYEQYTDQIVTAGQVAVFKNGNFLRGGNTTLKVEADATPVEAEAEAVSIPASEPELAANPEPALNVTLVKTLEGMTVELGTVTADYVQLVLAVEEGYTLPDALTMEVLGVGIYTIYTTTENIEANPDGVDCNVENNTITLYADFLKVSSGSLNITGFATADASA